MPSTKKRLNVKHAPKITKQGPQDYTRVLAYIGKPFYLLLVVLFIGVLYATSAIGYSLRIFITKGLHSIKLSGSRISKTLRAKTKFFKLRLKHLTKNIQSFRKFEPKFPTIILPSISLPQISPRFSFPHVKLRLRPERPFKKLFVLLSLATIPLVIFWFTILKDLPSPHSLTERHIEVSTKIYDRNGILLYKIFKDKNRTIIPFSEIPSQVRLATLAAEDAEFYTHKGISPRGILRAILKNLEKRELTGGSTITQQLVKNALLSPEKTLSRKLKEVTLAFEVELTYTKDQILEMYLNEVSYGGTAYGISEAASVYFDKKVSDLTIAESAYLAGLPRSPSKYSPFSGNFDAGILRQKDVLNLMQINGYISDQEKIMADEEKLIFITNRIDIKAPHFVMYTRNLLADKYGEEVVETGGLDVITTLDYGIQKMAEEILKSEVDKLKGMRVGNGAVVILDPHTNEILAMVGSKDYFDIANDGNVNVTIQPRSPGSSIKVVNYAYALSNNYTPASMIDDSPITYKVYGQPPYSPKNYDSDFHGNVSLRSALARSLNIPAVKILNSYGVAHMIELGRKMGITTWEDESRFGLSLTLGGGEVKLLNLAQVYSTIADNGIAKDTLAIKKITNYKNEILESGLCQTPDCEGTQVLDPRVSYMLIDMLKDNNARAPSFGRLSQLVVKGHPEVAVKTGTSNDLRDNLTVGMTPDYVVAVWVGNNDSSPMSRVASGLTGASSIFNKIMSSLLSDQEVKNWPVPEGLVQLPICTITGSLTCNGCPTRREWFLTEKRPAFACNPNQILAYKKSQEEKNRSEGQILDRTYSTEFLP